MDGARRAEKKRTLLPHVPLSPPPRFARLSFPLDFRRSPRDQRLSLSSWSALAISILILFAILLFDVSRRFSSSHRIPSDRLDRAAAERGWSQ